MADFFRRAGRCPGRHSVPGRVNEPGTNGVAVEVAARPGVNYIRGIPPALMEEERVPSAGSSTTPAPITYRRQGRARAARRVHLGLLGAFLVLGLLTVFGSRTASVSADSNGYSMRVVYPQATRSSLPVKWELTLTRPGGFPGPVRIGIPIDYFNLFDFNNTYPLPTDTLNEGGMVIMVFPAPAGDTL